MRYLFISSLISLLCLAHAFVATGQDLVITSYSGPTTYGRHAEFEHEFTLKYDGIVQITGTPSHDFYLSLDGDLDGSDYYIGYGQQESYELLPGESTLVTMSYSSINIEPGSYSLIYIVDPYNNITETDEDNNKIIISGITITAADIDFSFSSFDLDKSSYSPNETIDPAFLITNAGSTNVGNGLNTSFYLSTDNTLSEDDLYIANEYHSLMGSDDTEDWIHFRILTPQVAEGDYYLIARTNYYETDPTINFQETDLTNNTASKLISIVPFPPLDLSIPNAYLYGYSSDFYTLFNGTVDIQNSGSITIGNYQLEIQFRDVTGFPVTDYFTVPAYDNITPAFSYINTHFDFSLPPGEYRYSIRINSNQTIPETDYTNNEFVSTTSFIIEAPPIEQVTVNGLSVPDSYDNTDEIIALQLNLTNTGTDALYTQYFGIEITDAEGSVVFYNEISTVINFDPGTSSAVLISLELPAPLPVGDYLINIQDGSPYNTIFEQTITSFTIVPIQYSLTGTVKGEDGTSITKGKLFLYQKDNAGNVAFIQKIAPYVGPTFLFQLDQHQHTLYFIPDPTLFPDYVPTIFGKTVTLSPDNFFTAAADMDTVFRILKVKPLGTGKGFINGVVVSNDNSGGRTDEDGVPMTDVPVLLLSTTGDVVAITYTDSEGFYEFTNLPRNTYQVVVSTELDLIQVTPFVVDISTLDANVNFVFSPNGVETSINEVVGTEDNPIAVTYYPNPTHDKVKLSLPQQAVVTVVNSIGNMPVNVPYKNEELDFTQVPAGVYLVKIQAGDKTRVLKLVRN